jgi:recombination protein RecR
MSVVPKALEDVVDAFAQLPGVGRRTAFRYALHLLRNDRAQADRFSETIARMGRDLCRCATCMNISDSEQCTVCANPTRDRTVICLVEDMRDVISVEATGQFRGLYHVLGGILSPMDGIGPADLNIPQLLRRLQDGTVREVIMALPATMEGDTTCFYLYRQMQPNGVKVTSLSRGISVGGGLEYADELTLGRSIMNRIPYENSIQS